MIGGEKLHPPHTNFRLDPPVVMLGLLLLALLAVAISLPSVAVITLCLLFALIITGIYFSQQVSTRAVVQQPSGFIVNGRANLIIRNPIGTLRIWRSEAKSVVVVPTKYVGALSPPNAEGPAVIFNQYGDTINVIVSSVLGRNKKVDLDITVPEISDLQINSNAGSIHIEGITGQLAVSTDTGSIHMRQVNGQITASTDAGSIHLQQARLYGQSSLQTDAGSINFHGVLDPQGNYCFKTDAGSIHVALPIASSFILNASTDIGTVRNHFGTNLVGDTPQAELELHTHLGSVVVQCTETI